MSGGGAVGTMIVIPNSYGEDLPPGGGPAPGDFSRFRRRLVTAALVLAVAVAAGLRAAVGAPEARGFALGAAASVAVLWLHARAVEAYGVLPPAEARHRARRGAVGRFGLRAGAGLAAAAAPGVSLAAALAGLLVGPVAAMLSPLVGPDPFRPGS